MAEGDGKSFVGSILHMKKSGILWVVVAGAALGLILLFWGNFNFDKSSNDSGKDSGTSGMTIYEYEEKIKAQVKSACESVSGQGSVSFVAVYFGSGYEEVYAQDVQKYKDGQYKSEYVIMGSGNNARPLKIGENLPTLSGIGVVCTTSNEKMAAEMASLLSGIYGLPLNRIYITSSSG